MLFEWNSSISRFLLQFEDCLDIESFEWETLFALFGKSTQNEIIFGIVIAVDIDLVIDKLKEHLFNLVDLPGCVLGKDLSKIVVFKGFIIPNFRGNDKGSESDSLPVDAVQEHATFSD